MHGTLNGRFRRPRTQKTAALLRNCPRDFYSSKAYTDKTLQFIEEGRKR